MIEALKDVCTGCGACQTECVFGAISMGADQDGFWTPVVDSKKCVRCSKCVEICPITHIVTSDNTPAAYAAYNTDEQTRLSSSSGGIFRLIADQIIGDGGVVFGAAFDERFRVVHTFTESSDGLTAMQGSKYVQSFLGDSFKRVEAFLNEGRVVLFTGTPCQVSGLKAYLRRDDSNLFTQDVVCHGVPSPKLWQKYVAYREKRAGSETRSVSFRNKASGWRRFSVAFQFSNGEEYRQTFDKDMMMMAFLKNICLRPSCYDCRFKSISRQSDITLADFWGIWDIAPEMSDNQGISLIITQSQKGEFLFDQIKEQIVYRNVDADIAAMHNSTMIRSADVTMKRDSFFRDLDLHDLDRVIRKYCGTSIIKKLWQKF